MIARYWRILCKAVFIAGVLFTGFVLLELFRIGLLFYRLSPIAGLAYAVIIGGGVVIFFIYAAMKWLALPRVLIPPKNAVDLSSLSARELSAYGEYLGRYLRRLSRNPVLEDEDRAFAKEQIFVLQQLLQSRQPMAELAAKLESMETEIIHPLLDILEKAAEEEVRRSVRDVMLGVCLSPYHSVDLLIVIYRNVAMVLRVSHIFNSRPLVREQMLILGDTIRVVAAVNIINMSRTLIESLFSNLPFVGGAVDDIAQGLGAGLFTSAAGHAAIERCAAFRNWSKERAVNDIAGRARAFFTDVRDMFTKDVLPQIKGKLRPSVPEGKVEEPGFWDTVSAGINKSVETTAKTMDILIVQPTVFGTRGVVQAGTAVGRGVVRAGTGAARGTHRASQKTYHGTRRILHTFLQRLRYGSGPRR